MVLAFKEHGRGELARPLGAALALAATVLLCAAPGASAGRGPVLLVPVPSSAAAVQRRGRDHVRELAGCAAAELRDAGVPAEVLPVLRRGRGTRDSAGLDAGERRRNLAGRFRVQRPWRGAVPEGRLVLVDDVVTSGATLTEAARALAELVPGELAAGGPPAGPEGPVVAAVVAATPRRRPRTVLAERPVTITVRN
jgi:predicted amidophosphoribosyltransferase